MPVLVLLLVAMLAELAVVVVVGQAIGALTTVLLLVAVSVAGVALLRRQGTQALGAFGEAVRHRRDPQPELLDGMLVAVAGALVLFPGFVSDVLALPLLLPPTRAMIRNRMLRNAERRRPARAPEPMIVDSVVVDPVDADTVIVDSVVVDDPPARRDGR